MSKVMFCSYCGSRQHTITNCPKTWQGQANRNRMYCTYCGSREHNIAACPKTYSGNAARTWDDESVQDDFVEDGR